MAVIIPKHPARTVPPVGSSHLPRPGLVTTAVRRPLPAAPLGRRPDPSVVAVGPELAWLVERGLAIRLPDDPPAGEGRDGRPVLHVLARSAAPPPCSALEDWIRIPIDRDDLVVRADRLLARARARRAPSVAVVDGVLRSAGAVEVLSPQEERLIGALLAKPDQLVSREELVAAIWPDGAPSDPRALDNRVKTLRRRLDRFPLRLHTVRGRGLLIELLEVA